MKASNFYLHFDGNCREAMTFYGKCLQVTPCFTTYTEGPPEVSAAAASGPDRILHSELGCGSVVLMASDAMPGTSFHQGNNFAISIGCESLDEMERLFAALSENGSIVSAMHDAFWGGRFGVFTDRFGIGWMLSFR